MSYRAVAALVLVLSVVACGGVRDRIRFAPALAGAAFDARELIDVLPPGRIPAITEPRFEPPGSAADWLRPEEPVIAVTVGSESRAYPLAIMVWHEVVDDQIGAVPVAVTYSPLTNAAIVFDRRVGERNVSFAASGKLFRSDLVMAGPRTETLWTQLDGRAVAGPLRGAALPRLPSQIVSLEQFTEAFSGGSVLARPADSGRGYGFNPYAGYESRSTPYGGFIARKTVPGEAPMGRIIGFGDGSEARAYPYRALIRNRVIAARVAGKDVVVWWRPGARSALDTARISDGRDVGQTGVFSAVSEGRKLDFEATDEGFRDRRTGSTWSVLGVATAGPLKGTRLMPVVHLDTFWFAWTAFYPARIA